VGILAKYDLHECLLPSVPYHFDLCQTFWDGS